MAKATLSALLKVVILAVEEQSGSGWEVFINSEVAVIVNDPPSDVPKRKQGLLKSITDTHAILLLPNGNPEAILLTLIRRMELPKKNPDEGWH